MKCSTLGKNISGAKNIHDDYKNNNKQQNSQNPVNDRWILVKLMLASSTHPSLCHKLHYNEEDLKFVFWSDWMKLVLNTFEGLNVIGHSQVYDHSLVYGLIPWYMF